MMIQKQFQQKQQKQHRNLRSTRSQTPPPKIWSKRKTPVGPSNRQDALIPASAPASVSTFRKRYICWSNDQEMAQSERKSHYKNQDGKKTQLAIRYLF